MATAYLDPASNVNTLWSLNGFANIDKATRQPTVPDGGTFCQAGPSDDNEAQAWGLDVLSTLDNITEVKVWIYSGQNDNGNAFQVSIEIGGSYQTNQSFTPVDAGEPQDVNLSTWQSKTFTTGAPWATSAFSASKIRITSPTLGTGDEASFFAVYAELTGTAVAGGGGGSTITLQGPLALLLGSKN